MKYTLISLLIFVSSCSFCQVANFVSWEIQSTDLTNGKLAFVAGQSKKVTYTVKVQRFLTSSGAWTNVNFKFKPALLSANSAEPKATGYENNVTSTNFNETEAITTVTFTTNLIAATNPTDDDSFVKNTDTFALQITDASYPNGWYLPSKNYSATIVPLLVTFKPNPSVSKFSVPKSTSVTISGSIDIYTLSAGTYTTRIFYSNTISVYELFENDAYLTTGSNSVDAKFTLGDNLFGPTTGKVYAEVQKTGETTKYISAPIFVEQTSAPTYNKICCGNQCLLPGQTPAILIQEPGTTVDLTRVIKIDWVFCVKGYMNPGHAVDNGNITCAPGATSQTVEYWRTMIYPDGNVNYSNGIVLSITPLAPLKNFANNTYNSNTTNSAYDIKISGLQSTSQTVTVDFVAANQIIISPGAKLSNNINLKIDKTIFQCTYPSATYLPSDYCTYDAGRIATSESLINSLVPINETKKENIDYPIAYPNPSYGETSIKYLVSTISNVELYISDGSGRPTTTLVNNQNVPVGVYETVFDANGLNSGIYFYTIIINGQKQVRKIIIVSDQSKAK